MAVARPMPLSAPVIKTVDELMVHSHLCGFELFAELVSVRGVNGAPISWVVQNESLESDENLSV